MTSFMPLVGLVDPPVSIHNTTTRLQVRLVNLLYLVALTLMVLGLLVGDVIRGNAQYVAVSVMVLLLTVYGLNRVGRYCLAFLLTLVGGYAVIVLNALMAASPTTSIVFVAVMPMFAAIMFSHRVVGGLVIVSSVLALLVAEEPSIFGFVVASGMITVIATTQRHTVESEHQRQMREHAAWLNLLLDQMPAIVWTTDSQNRVTFAQGRSLDDSILAAMQVQPESNFAFEWESVPYQVRREGLYGSAGEPIGTIGVAVDVSFQQRAMSSLQVEREQNRAIGDLVQNASHDLRTPLSTVKTYLYLLQRQAPEHQDKIDIINGQLGYMSAVFDNMMTMTMLDTRVRLAFKKGDVNHLVQMLAVRAQSSAFEAGLDLRLDAADSPLYVLMDEKTLLDGLYRVVENAVQNTPAGGQITVTVRLCDNHARIVINDSGTGIAPDDLPHVFERFFRADRHRPITNSNSGLGLSIAKKVIEKHEGRIDIASTLGEGTTVTIDLPLVWQRG
jgi:signal transduction histidine kinase